MGLDNGIILNIVPFVPEQLDFPEEIELCGTVSSICVASNATILKSLYPEMSISVLKDLCADLSTEGHEAAMKVLNSQQIIIK